MLAATIAVAVFMLVAAIWALGHGVVAIRARTRDWRAAKESDLGRARARRPHASDADPLVAHDEYAVAVSDAGDLVTFAFTPLAAYERAAPGSVLIPGRPGTSRAR